MAPLFMIYSDRRAACLPEGTRPHMPLLLLSEEENREAGLLGGAGPQAHEPGPERAAAREVRPGEVHRLRRAVCGRVLPLQEKEDN